MKRRFLLSFVFIFLSFSIFAENKLIVDISVKTENIAESEATWLSPAVKEKLEANLSKYTDFTFINSNNRQDIFEIQKQSEGEAFDEEDAIEIGKLKNADYVLFTTLRKAGGNYTVSVRLTNVSTGVNKVSAIISSPISSVQNIYSSNGCSIDEITIEFCKALGKPLTKTEEAFLMNGDLSLSKEEKQSIYDADVKLYNNRIEELNKEISTLSKSTDLEAISKQERLKAEKVLAEEKLKLAKENQKRAEEEINQRKTDELKNAQRSIEQQNRITSISEELNNKVQSVRNAKFDNQSLIGQIQVIELKKKAVIDIHNSIIDEMNNICDTTLKNILDTKKEIDERPYRSTELLEDGKTPSDFAIEARENMYNQTKDKLIATGQGDINLLTDKLCLQKNTLLKEIDKDYTKLKPRKISTLGNELVVTYGAYIGDKQGWKLNITVKSDNIILFQTKSFLSFKTLTGKDPAKYAKEDYYAYLDDVDFYDSLFLRGEPVLTFELEYSAKPEDVTKPSCYNFNFYNFKCFDTKTLKVNKNKISSSKSYNLSLDEKNIIRKLSPVCDLQPTMKTLPTLENLIQAKLLNMKMEEAGLVTNVRRLPAGTIGTYGTKGQYVEFGNWPKTVKANNVTIDEKKTELINGWTCYKGSDNCFYIKTEEMIVLDAYGRQPKKIVKADGKYLYFKLEPITWRVVTDDYQGGKLLIAENILSYKRYNRIEWDWDHNYYNTSEIRTWLNEDFLKGAFTNEQIQSINTVNVDNSKKSTGYSDNTNACENTQDKIFLLSGEEVTTSDYGFNSDDKENDTARIRFPTDYSFNMDKTDIFEWWLRSPRSDDYTVRIVNEDGRASSTSFGYYNYDFRNMNSYLGIVPALSISF